MIVQSAASPAVDVAGMSKIYGQGEGQVSALVNISLTVEKGRHVAIIGPSGSGKSTLLHLIAGLTSPTAGQVTIGGQSLNRMGDRELTLYRRKHIGIVFQAYNLVPTLSVEDNIRLPLLLGGSASQANRVEAIMERLGLTQRRRHRPDQLSGGEQQRVAIGRAIVTDPVVLLADEPTGNLDTNTSRHLCELMHWLSNCEGRTIITVTHDPAVAVWADQVLVLKDGRIVASIDTAACPTAGQLGTRFQEALSGAEVTACA